MIGLLTLLAITPLLFGWPLVVLTGLVGQISFCQYSFAALGAFTVGSLVGGHHWSFWMALVVGTAFAAAGGVLVGIPALRLSGLFLAILTVAVALFFDRFLLAPGTWDALSGGVEPWRPARPSVAGIGLDGSYAFYLFVLPPLLAKTFMRPMFIKMGFIRFFILVTLLQFMAALPIKMLLRWIFNLKYIVALPEIFFNI